MHVKNQKSLMFSCVTETWNPVTGCLHGCVYCWSRKFARRLKHTEKYKEGFVPKLHEKEFKRRFGGGLVFVSDMGDLFGEWVPKEWILRVLNHIKKFPETAFLFLTKNPERYGEFLDYFPENAILGATIETTDDWLYEKYNISRAPLPSERYKAMKKLDWNNKFISIEPILDFDLDLFVKWIKDIEPICVYVGYDNYKNDLPEPPLPETEALIKNLSKITSVHVKTLRDPWWMGIVYKIKEGMARRHGLV